jgi:hypothetical protein
MATTLKDTTINTTGFLKVATGTFSERPLTPQQGDIRFNPDNGKPSSSYSSKGRFEYFNGSYWRSIF